MAPHPELEAEQAYIDHAYASLEEARVRAMGLRRLGSVGPGGTHQARYESEIAEDAMRARLAQLYLADDVALVFGRIDMAETDERFHIGRVAVADVRQEPVVVDWRAPVAEPFYRATGRSPMGLSLRRHFAVRGRQLLDIEDEVFDAAHARDGVGIVGAGALRTVLGRSRSGYLGDIVATIQIEQDEIIRSELGGVMVVQGGPGTGKTVVALHRAAYLLYTHRFPLEGQGVLVVGPNRLYQRYVERVLPSLGEAGVELVVLADLVPETIGDSREPVATGRIKGDLRMVRMLARAVRDRQRPLRSALTVGFGLEYLRCTVEASDGIVRMARRRSRSHNGGRRHVEQALWEELAHSARGGVDAALVRERLSADDDVRAALEWMWPALTPAELLRDLFGSKALIRSAGTALSGAERAALERPREAAERVAWSLGDVALLDEARSILGPRPRRDGDPGEVRTYGHIVVDEAQDLSPMQLRMLARRSLNGSMTVVGDTAQATGPWAPERWDEVLAHLPSRRPSRLQELTIGYRTPASILQLANRVLEAAAPGLQPPQSLREGGDEPTAVQVPRAELARRVAEVTEAEREVVGEGNVAVLSTDAMLDELDAALTERGVDHGLATRTALDRQVTLVPVRLVKGLELDAVVVVEPARIVAEEPQGLRSLYVALTRATRRLAVVHADPLPEEMQERRNNVDR
ncbi:MAG: AAA family ATPase [Actinomycetota bacterium]|nr:AAA family ATPase [Actinomycetota bacterium]